MGHSRQTGQIRQNGRSGGFVLRELAAVSAVVAVGLSAVMVGAGQSRKSAGLAGSLANLKKIGEAGGSYLADFDDQLWSFTWSRDEHPTDYSDLQNPGSNTDAVAYQAVDIARRLGKHEWMPRMQGICRPPFLSTLVLADYLGDDLPAEWMIAPGDAVRQGWLADLDDPPDFYNGQGGAAWELLFGFYGGSYGLMPAFWAPDEKVGSQPTVSQYKPQHDFFTFPSNMVFGRRRASEVSFPGQKVQVAEREAFYFGVRAAYYLHPSARVPLMMADGSASARTTADANTSFLPNNPGDVGAATLLDYRPNPAYEAASMSDTGIDEDLDGKYKWTRRGLRGIDFAGERAE